MPNVQQAYFHRSDFEKAIMSDAVKRKFVTVRVSELGKVRKDTPKAKRYDVCYVVVLKRKLPRRLIQETYRGIPVVLKVERDSEPQALFAQAA